MQPSTSQGYQPRLADERLRQLLAEFPAVMINGPRATGKTTTGRQLASDVVQLDRPAQAAAFRADADAALRRLAEPVLLDEWQEVPEVLGAVKRAVDEDSRPGRFILTGSVRTDLERPMWPATGRVIRMPMYGLTEREVTGRIDHTYRPFLDRLEAGDAAQIPLPPLVPDLPAYIDLSLRSGFPEVAYQHRDESARRVWLDSYLDQLLTRDAASLDHARDPARLGRYFEALALNTAGLARDKVIYDAAGVTAKTAAAYDQLLMNLLVLEHVPAWSTNRLHRLIKTPKRYLVDAGLIGSAAGLDSRAVLADGDLFGRLIDTFVLTQLRAEAALSTRISRFHHFRTELGRQEVDLVVERGAGRFLAIEIKAGVAPDLSDARHLVWLRDEMPDRFIAGAVLHTGPATYQLSERIVAVPICALWG